MHNIAFSSFCSNVAKQVARFDFVAYFTVPYSLLQKFENMLTLIGRLLRSCCWWYNGDRRSLKKGLSNFISVNITVSINETFFYKLLTPKSFKLLKSISAVCWRNWRNSKTEQYCEILRTKTPRPPIAKEWKYTQVIFIGRFSRSCSIWLHTGDRIGYKKYV